MKAISDNDKEDDDDEGLHSLEAKELTLVCQSYSLPISRTKPVWIDDVLQQMSALQVVVEEEANVDVGSNDVIDNGVSFDALHEWDLLRRICACAACVASVKTSNRYSKVRDFVLSIREFDVCSPLDVVNYGSSWFERN